MKQVFGKLVRDRIPEIISAKGETAHTRVLDDLEYIDALYTKFEEEIGEVKSAESIEALQEELADVLEVLQALAVAQGIGWDGVEYRRKEKEEKRGGFSKKLFLESTE